MTPTQKISKQSCVRCGRNVRALIIPKPDPLWPRWQLFAGTDHDPCCRWHTAHNEPLPSWPEEGGAEAYAQKLAAVGGRLARW